MLMASTQVICLKFNVFEKQSFFPASPQHCGNLWGFSQMFHNLLCSEVCENLQQLG